mmetsp:Transcript_8785/g.39590  ORF Transcript_8785/g.39590 Transcript_8785/m.39590 type:complete len:184 (-) Transcript_8785:2374-2925(-)
MAGRGYAPQTNFGEAPKGYVPGMGRGAAGFMTRSDLGGAVAPAPGQGGLGEGAGSRSALAKFSRENAEKAAGAEGGGGDADAGSVTAALGTKWAHCVNTRLVLEGAAGAEGADGKANDGEDAGYHQRRRVIKVVKSPRCPLVGFECDVYAGGIRVDGDKVVKVDPSGADAQGGIRGIYQGAAV